MKPLGVVDLIDEPWQPCCHIPEGLVAGQVHLLDLQRLHKALYYQATSLNLEGPPPAGLAGMCRSRIDSLDPYGEYTQADFFGAEFTAIKLGQPHLDEIGGQCVLLLRITAPECA